MISLKEYQDFTPETFVYGKDVKHDLDHVLCGLFAESGEVAAAYQKYYRGDYDDTELLERVQKELGGLMYYSAMLCNLEGLQMEEIISRNAAILKDRMERGVIKGDGDNR